MRVAFIFISLFISSISNANFSKEICKDANLNKATTEKEANKIHALAISKIPEGKLTKASHEEYISYLQEFERLIGTNLNLNISEIKSLFNESKDLVLQSLQADTSLSTEIKSEMTARIQQSEFLLPSEYAQLAPDEGDATYALLMTCGFGKPYDNAFAISSRRWVVVCPGRLVRAALQPNSLRLFSLLRGLAHEMGHHIDSEAFSDQYNYWFGCISTSLSKLKAPYSKYFGELSADYWAVSTVLQALKQLPLQINRMFLLKNSFSDICETSESAPALSGDDRIDVILRSHILFNGLFPTHAAYLKCKLH